MTALDIETLHHIQLAMPRGQEEKARTFYRDVLGLREVAKPLELQGRGGCWFGNDRVAVHLGVENPFLPAQKAHPAFSVANLDSAHDVLTDYNPTAISTLPGLRRFYIADPFGNRIEIVQTD